VKPKRRQIRTPRPSDPILLPAFLLIVITCAAYSGSFAGLLVFDDEPAIAANDHIRRLWPLSRSMAAPPDTTVSGRPVVSLTLALNYALAPRESRDVFGAPHDAPPGASNELYRNLWGYHAVNLAIHVLAALALCGVTRRTLLSARLRDRFGSAATPLAFAIALLWALHPVQTASVTYVVQRAESLMGLFYLVTIYCAIRAGDGPARDSPAEAGRHARKAGWIAAAVAACALGMGTKEAMATAPLIVMAWDWVFAADGWWSRRWSLYLGLGTTWLILAALVAGGYRTHAVGFGFAGWSWLTYLITQAGVVAHYLRLAVLPFPLVLDYDWPAARSLADVAPQATLVLALVGLTTWALVRRQPVGFAGAWFFGILAPTSSVIPIVTEVAAEQRLYLPLAAVIWILVLGAYAVWPARLRAALGVAGAALAVVFAFLTDVRNRDYQSYERIWSDTIHKRPLNARARTNYATALLLKTEYAQAEEQLRVAVAARPELAEAYANLGVALCAQGKLDEGIGHLQRAIAIQPDYSAAYEDLGEAYATRGEWTLAVKAYERALAGRPDEVRLLNRTGWILATASDERVRDGARAVALAERATRLTNRQHVESLDTLAAAYAQAGRFGDAVAAGRDALAAARTRDDRAIIPELEQRLELYRSQRPFRQ
jgi:tetratricopeptide (TPR) repeat protein